MKEFNSRLAKPIKQKYYLQIKNRWTSNDYQTDRKMNEEIRQLKRGIKGIDKMKKIYTEKGLDELIRIYGFEHKKVIEYAKRLDKQEKV